MTIAAAYHIHVQYSPAITLNTTDGLNILSEPFWILHW